MSAPNPSTAQATTMVDELVRCGLTDAVIAPGSRSTALVFALAQDGRIRTHVQIDERSAGFLALGMGRVTGRPAAVVTTSGTATANLHPAVVEADRSAVPLLVLTADRPPEARGTDANQTIDQVGLYGGSVRLEVDVAVAEDRPDAVPYWRSTVCRAYVETLGRGGSAPGPVHVNLPFREPTVPATDDGRTTAAPFPRPTDGRPGGAPWIHVPAGRRRLENAAIGALAERCAGTPRGLVVAGEGSPDADAVHTLADRLGWPVVAEPLSGARDRDGVIAAHHHLLGADGFVTEHRPDLILRFGRAGLSPHLMRLLGSEIPQVAVLPDDRWSDPRRATATVLVAEPTALATALNVSLGDGEADPDWRGSWRAADRTAAAAIEDVLSGEERLTEPAAARRTAASAPSGAALVVGSSMPVRDLDAFMLPRPGLLVHGNRGASGIDGYVSTALGVASAHDGPTVGLTGDLSLLHDANGFLLDHAGLDLTIVVVNNDGGGIFHFLPQARHPEELERYFATPHGRDLAALARWHGVGHDEVSRPGELDALLSTPGGVRIIEIRTDRAANVALHERITAAVSDALG